MIDKEDLDDIFGIPQDNSHLDDDNASTDDVAFGSVVSKNGVSKKFDDQILALSSNMKTVSNEVSDPETEDLIKKVVKPIDGGVENVIQKQKANQSTQKNDENTASVKRKNDDEIFPESQEHLGRIIHNDKQLNILQVVSAGNDAQHEQVNISSSWKLEDNNLAFSNFYKLKKNAINGWLLPGGEINFDLVHDELVNAKVDLSSIGFGDFNSMFDSLKNIQHWKDRVTEISMRTNAQYYTWKRAVDLFRGTLARMYYEKPSEKQEGVVMEHMGDMVRYYSQLEALHASVDAVSRNLDNAFDCVSRQITVCLPMSSKDIESVDKRLIKKSDNISSEILSEADSIPEMGFGKSRQNQNDKTIGKKIGTVDWKDI